MERKTTWRSGLLNDTYPTRIWSNKDGSVDFGIVFVPSKTGGKNTEYNDHFEGPVYEVIITPAADRPGGIKLECPCPGFEYRGQCRRSIKPRAGEQEVIVDRERRVSEPFGGLGVPHEVPKGRWLFTEAYQGEVYPVIHAIPPVVGCFACCEDSRGRSVSQRDPRPQDQWSWSGMPLETRRYTMFTC